MNLPCYYMLYYQNHQIIYMDGWYKIPDLVCPLLPDMNAAKAKIDEYEKLFNEKSTHAKENNVGD